MAKQCADCGTWQRRLFRADGSEDWLCVNCAREADRVIAALDATVDELDIDARDETAWYAFGIADAIRQSAAVSGRSPAVVAAACVYLGSILADEKLTQDDVTDAADVSQSTVRDTYRDLYDASGYADEFGPIEGGELQPEDVSVNPNIRLDVWREEIEQRQKRESVKATVSNVRRFAYWYDGDSEPDSDDASAWLGRQAEQGYSPSTIEGRYSSLRQYFSWAGLGELTAESVDLEEHKATAWQKKIEA